MFKKKDKPELYEILRQSKAKGGPESIRGAQKEEERCVQAPPAATPEPAQAGPYNTPSSAPAKSYPYMKFRVPFPVAKAKEQPTVRTQPAPTQRRDIWTTQPAQMSRRIEVPKKKTLPKIQRKPIPLKYIVITLVLLCAVAAVLYLALKSPASHPDVTSGGRVETPAATAPAPAQSVAIWSNRLIWYNDNTEGRASFNKMTDFLRRENIKSFTKIETLQGARCIVIYSGEFSSAEEARKELPKLKKSHFAFKNAEPVALKKER